MRTTKDLNCLAVAETGEDAPTASGTVLVPTLQKVQETKCPRTKVQVQVHNLSPFPVTLPPKSKLGELHRATLVSQSIASSDATVEDSFLSSFSFGQELTSDQLAQVHQLLIKWKSVFSL